MQAIILCFAAFLITAFLGSISLVAGLSGVLAVGYFYGIIRANVLDPASHFIFDAAVLGLYFTQLMKSFRDKRSLQLKTWLVFLCGWPVILSFVPYQEVMIQLVGVRGNIYFLFFLLLGARLDQKRVYQLGLLLGGLNIVAFMFSILEFIYGVPKFFPVSPVTELIYRSNLETTKSLLRIPSTFANAHSYGSAMVSSLPLILGVWLQRSGTFWNKWFLILAITVTVLGVFMSATRTNAIALFVLFFVLNASPEFKKLARLGFLIIVILVVYIVAKEERFQRFATLQNAAMIQARFEASNNQNFITALVKYPLGNGLGGGGTSIPFFLQARIQNRIFIENEYGRILLEQGIPGLIIWIGFVFWIFTRKTIFRGEPWYLTRRLYRFVAMTYFGIGLIGVGLLTAIPHSCLLLLMLGWILVPQYRKPVPQAIALPGAAKVSGLGQSKTNTV